MEPPLGWEITEEVQELVDKHIMSYLRINPYHNATYPREEIGQIVLNSVSSKKFITSTIEIRGKGEEVPSSSDLFRQLRKATSKMVLQGFIKANTSILAHVKKWVLTTNR